MAAHQAPRPWDSPGKNTGVGCHFLVQCMKVKSESEVAQSCPTSSSLPGPSVHGIFQARVLEWVARPLLLTSWNLTHTHTHVCVCVCIKFVCFCIMCCSYFPNYTVGFLTVYFYTAPLKCLARIEIELIVFFFMSLYWTDCICKIKSAVIYKHIGRVYSAKLETLHRWKGKKIKRAPSYKRQTKQWCYNYNSIAVFLLWRCYSLSHVWLFAIPWTVACQIVLSLAFSRQEY